MNDLKTTSVATPCHPFHQSSSPPDEKMTSDQSSVSQSCPQPKESVRCYISKMITDNWLFASISTILQTQRKSLSSFFLRLKVKFRPFPPKKLQHTCSKIYLALSIQQETYRCWDSDKTITKSMANHVFAYRFLSSTSRWAPFKGCPRAWRLSQWMLTGKLDFVNGDLYSALRGETWVLRAWNSFPTYVFYTS